MEDQNRSRRYPSTWATKVCKAVNYIHVQVGDMGHTGKMTVSEAMQGVKFEWTAERSVKLKIRDSTLTFST